MVRNAGKFGKQKRGGGRSFSKFMTLDENGVASGIDRRNPRKDADAEDDSDDSEEVEDEDEDGSGEEGEEEEDEVPVSVGASTGPGPSALQAGQELSRQERKKLKKEQKGGGNQLKGGKSAGADGEEEEEEDEVLANPNRVQKKMKIQDLGAPRELSRREREAKEKKDAQEKYWKMHMEGKTEQARKDLERLAIVRKEREEAAAKKKAESEAKQKEIEARKAGQRKRA